MQEDKVLLKIKQLPQRGNKHKAGYIDSIIFKDRSFEHIFSDTKKFIIHMIKGIGIGFRELRRWYKLFGKYVSRNIIEAKIVYCYKGDISLVLVRYSSNKTMQNLIFAGINGYTEKSASLKELTTFYKNK